MRFLPVHAGCLGQFSCSGLRIRKLHESVRPGQGMTKEIKEAVGRDAWIAKKFCVLVKRKLQKGQLCRDKALLAPAPSAESQAEEPVEKSDITTESICSCCCLPGFVVGPCVTFH